MIYIFDGSLEGLLTAVFEWFERKPGFVNLGTEKTHQPGIFFETFLVETNRAKADRVWNGLQKKLSREWLRKFYCAYLSELPEVFDALFHFATYIFLNPAGAEKNYGNEFVLKVSKTARSVEREKHRMESFIRFQHTSDGVFYCGIDPDFNVLPLIANHFKNRYADQQWIIYDLKRHYGLFYDLNKVEEMTMNINSQAFKNPKSNQLDEKEILYANLWKDYFKSTNIESRKNTKLHVQHVPKRYWKYLTEKQI
ncbi:TIGR03915 family putative DNA repair protein [Pedobacter boryungensis]|uniref:TIGR03915 family putative DNA repair protein n=1 Tax=Pedobacter boryungensis TaxID=869962 RepID=A0ABX2DFQ9_9SPHI|nr:TIGR03915 family putative DNA repair protein [Pedobacter boryungensis]NQX31811.1 TIGR03915 family putative DNA repair protein [Pedobacter boryungensis]